MKILGGYTASEQYNSGKIFWTSTGNVNSPHSYYYKHNNRWIKFKSGSRTGSIYENWTVTWSVEVYTSSLIKEDDKRGSNTGETQEGNSRNEYPDNGKKGNSWYVYDGTK